MKVILLTDVKGKGKKDEIIEVAAGYGMHLIREKKAVEASKGGVKVLDNQKEQIEKHNEELKKQALKDKEVLERKPLNFELKVGKDGRVFKSISQKQLIDRMASDYNIKVDKKKIKTKDSINSLGVTNVEIELYKGVVATLKVAIKEK